MAFSPHDELPTRRMSRLNPSRLNRTGPVFVDASGRKLRRMRAAGILALALVAGYLAVLGVAFLGGGPNAAAPFLPPAAGTSTSATHTSPSAPAPAGPAAPLADSDPTAAPEGPRLALQPAPAASQPPQQAGQAAGPAPAASSAALPAASAPPAATAPPNQANPSAPGQSRRPTPPAHP